MTTEPNNQEERLKAGDLFIQNATDRVYECIGTDEGKIWYESKESIEAQSFFPDECSAILPKEKQAAYCHVLSVYDTQYPQTAVKEINSFIAGAHWQQSQDESYWEKLAKSVEALFPLMDKPELTNEERNEFKKLWNVYVSLKSSKPK